ncbi:MAG: hypothetical protein FWH02_03120 [Oscillospiraceae bacterium]|nr:hypothetical protein [Oscillospiraceae bacterium]
MNRFYYDRLSPEEQAAYRKLGKGLSEFAPTVNIKTLGGGEASLLRVAEAVNLDNPGLCFHSPVQMNFGISPVYSTFFPEWTYEKDEALAVQKELKAAAGKILSGIPPGAKAYDKVKFLHDYFVRTLRYRALPQSDRTDFHGSHTVIGPLQSSTGVCEGFAKTAALLLRQAGIPAMVVRGDSMFVQDGDPFHAWNCLQIDGKNYHVDITWDNTLAAENGPIRYDYLCLSDEETARDHSNYTAPACTDNTGSYFHREGLCVAGKSALDALLARQTAKRAPHITFKLLPVNGRYPADIQAVVQEAVGKTNIATYMFVASQTQRVVMLSDIEYRGR